MDSWGLAAEIASGASIERAIVPQIGVMLGKPLIKHLAHLHEVRPFDTLGGSPIRPSRLRHILDEGRSIIVASLAAYSAVLRCDHHGLAARLPPDRRTARLNPRDGIFAVKKGERLAKSQGLSACPVIVRETAYVHRQATAIS